MALRAWFWVLAATLRWYSNEVQNRTELKVNVEVEGEPHPLTAEMNTALFRIAQEALTNTIKHAGPHAHAEVVVDYGSDALEISVRDNGRGASATDVTSFRPVQRPVMRLSSIAWRPSVSTSWTSPG